MKKTYSILFVISSLLFIGVDAFSQYCVPPTRSTTWRANQIASTTGAIRNLNNKTGMTLGYFDFTKSLGVTAKPGSQFKLTVDYYYGNWNLG